MGDGRGVGEGAGGGGGQVGSRSYREGNRDRFREGRPYIVACTPFKRGS